MSLAPARRALVAMLASLLVCAGLLAAPTAAHATTLTTTEAQWDLAALAYLPYSGIDGSAGPQTDAAAKDFQGDRCLSTDGIIGENTSAALRSLITTVQAKVGTTADGQAGPNTKAAIMAYQSSHGLTADGMAGPATMAKLGITRVLTCGGTGTGRTAPCAAGTRDLGTTTGYVSGTAVTLRLCAIPGLKSTAGESTSGSSYYVPGASGDIVVSTVISGQLLAMYKAGLATGMTLSAVSGFRSMAHQTYLFRNNSNCYPTYVSGSCSVAKPGYSNHQAGEAIDFATGGSFKAGVTSCAYKATTTSAMYSWLVNHAHTYGFRQFVREPWHWDTSTDSTRC